MLDITGRIRALGSKLIATRKPQLIGVDISSTSVKLIELARDGDGYRVESYAVEPLPPDAVVEKTLQDVNAVGEALKRALKRSGTKAEVCALAVAGSAVITKIITMPKAMGDEEMEAQIQLDADQYIPFALDEVHLDFCVQGPSKQSRDAVDVLLVASRSENVESRAAAAQLAGLQPKVMDVEPYCVESVLTASGDLQTEGAQRLIAVVDVGASMTCLDVFEDGRLIYTREQPFGGKELTEEIMRRYNMSYAEAGLAKKEGGLPQDYESEVLEPFKESLVQQVSRLLQFFYSASAHTSVDQIVLAGGCAVIEGIDELVEERMAIPTLPVNPFAGMSFSPRVNAQRLLKDAPAMLIACGLALRGFD